MGTVKTDHKIRGAVKLKTAEEIKAFLASGIGFVTVGTEWTYDLRNTPKAKEK